MIVAAVVVRPGMTELIRAVPAARAVKTTSIFVTPAGITIGSGAGRTSGTVEVNLAVVGAV